jgi:hypothetical protein
MPLSEVLLDFLSDDSPSVHVGQATLDSLKSLRLVGVGDMLLPSMLSCL